MKIQFSTLSKTFRNVALALLMSVATSAIALPDTQRKTEKIRIQDLEKYHGPIAAYIVEILELAISKCGTQYYLEKSTKPPVPQARQILDMSHNRGEFDVIWTMTSDEREKQMLPIRIPIDKGFFGWRIVLVNADQAPLFNNLKSIKELASFKAGQGQLWPDTEILRSNGLAVVTGSDESLPSMLKAKRFDYFPRPVIAIWNEQKIHSALSFEINNTFILHYSTAFYFFVAPNRKKLANDITTGLEIAIADSSFDVVFNKYFQTFIKQADIKNRQIFELKNPLIKDSSLPLNQPKLWYKP